MREVPGSSPGNRLITFSFAIFISALSDRGVIFASEVYHLPFRVYGSYEDSQERNSKMLVCCVYNFVEGGAASSSSSVYSSCLAQISTMEKTVF